MKRYYWALMLCMLTACNNHTKQATKSTTDSTQLSTSLVHNPASANGIDSAELANMPTMDFKDTLHNFGNVKEGETVEYDFAFVNNGKSPLIISNATGSCGCTIASYPQEPIMSGQGGVLKVVFSSAGKEGHQEKSVTVNTNAKKNIHMLYIQADVQKTNN